MAALFASGHAADLILIVMAIEAVALAFLTRLKARAIVAATLPGALIVCALRAALVGAAWPWIALFLLLSWPAHLGDVWLRTRTRSRDGLSP